MRGVDALDAPKHAKKTHEGEVNAMMQCSESIKRQRRVIPGSSRPIPGSSPAAAEDCLLKPNQLG